MYVLNLSLQLLLFNYYNYFCREERSEELRRVHENKMLYLNKTQTDMVKEILDIDKLLDNSHVYKPD